MTGLSQRSLENDALEEQEKVLLRHSYEVVVPAKDLSTGSYAWVVLVKGPSIDNCAWVVLAREPSSDSFALAVPERELLNGSYAWVVLGMELVSHSCEKELVKELGGRVSEVQAMGLVRFHEY